MNVATLVEGLRALGFAATRSVEAVRVELSAAIGNIAPAVDSVLIFDEEEGQLACVAARGSRVMYFAGVRLARTDLRTLPALALARGHRAALGENGARGFHPADAFAVAVPLVRTAGCASVVYAAAPQRVDAEALEAIVTLADHAGFAYTLAHEREAYLRRAEYDALTGLLSPRALRERLAAQIERARFAPLARIALLFVDTDRFKGWNDTYGHASGDALLRALANVLRASAGSDELVARNGGDEFCIVFTDTEKSRALERAEALRHAIEGLDLTPLRPAGNAPDVVITASIGVAAFPVDGRTPSELLERADEAMYHSKRTGRNAVSYFGVDGALVCLAGSSSSDPERTIGQCVPSMSSFT
jgi:diguanylate cyclase (GGDEF)-like protein